jgi:hypothetical protein
MCLSNKNVSYVQGSKNKTLTYTSTKLVHQLHYLITVHKNLSKLCLLTFHHKVPKPGINVILDPKPLLTVTFKGVCTVIAIPKIHASSLNYTQLMLAAFSTSTYMKSIIFWDITPCSTLKVKWCFRGTHCLHLLGQIISRARNQCESRWQADMLSRWFLARLIIRPWRWRRYVPPKRRLASNGLHGVIYQKIVLFITTTVRTSNSTYIPSKMTHYGSRDISIFRYERRDLAFYSFVFYFHVQNYSEFHPHPHFCQLMVTFVLCPNNLFIYQRCHSYIPHSG